METDVVIEALKLFVDWVVLAGRKMGSNHQLQ
jgi:hypothetical protein